MQQTICFLCSLILIISLRNEVIELKIFQNWPQSHSFYSFFFDNLEKISKEVDLALRSHPD